MAFYFSNLILQTAKQKNLCNNVLLYSRIFVQNNYITMWGRM